MEAVTAVLIERDADPHGLSPMVVCSMALHAVLIAMVLFVPANWTGATQHSPTISMTVNLGGAGGPETGGSSAIGGRPVQEAVTEPTPRPQPVLEPAAKTPEMTMPVVAPKVKPKPAKEKEPAKPVEVKAAPDDAHGRVPTRGAQEKFGSSFADTGVSGLGLGLSTGGAGGGGGDLDMGNFCCPDYLTTMARRIKENWNFRQGVEAVSVAKFTIQRDGRITDIFTEQSAGYGVLDLAAQRALLMVGRLAPLPQAYTYPSLTIYLQFKYIR